METYLIFALGILMVITILLIIIFRNKNSGALPDLQQKLEALQANLAKIESNLKEDFKINREENSGIAKTIALS